MKIYNKHNFHNNTFCIWKEVSLKEVQDLKISYRSKSGSAYIFTESGVYRISNHWGRAANCRWRLVSLSDYKNQFNTVGFANWTDFYPNDDFSKLYCIKVNFETKNVDFFHKNSEQYDQRATLRNASETAKVIQNIKLILNEVTWSKHLTYENFEAVQKAIISDLIFSDKSFIESKRKFIK